MLGALLSAGTSILGGVLGNRSAEKNAKRQEALQREFAQNAIQWKVQDAEKAGVHPLYALGANTVSYSPTQVGSTDFGLTQAGQDIGRAIDTGRSANERNSAISTRAATLQLENMELQNAKLASEIALTRQAGTPPPPITESPIIDGQGVNAHEVKAQPVQTHRAGDPGISPKANPDIEFKTVPLGNGQIGFEPMPSQQTAEAMESSWTAPIDFALRNRIAPSLGFRAKKPPREWLPQGYSYWQMNPLTGVYEPQREIRHRR